jgi:hypothetical protein
LPVADREQMSRQLADAVNVAIVHGRLFAVERLGVQAGLGRGRHKELLDHFRHQPPLFGFDALADDGRKVQLPLGQPLQRRIGDLAKPFVADVDPTPGLRTIPRRKWRPRKM